MSTLGPMDPGEPWSPDRPIPERRLEEGHTEAQADATGTRTPKPPFWSYEDLLVFVFLGLPCLLAATLISQTVLKFVPGPHVKAIQLVPAQFLAYGLWFTCLWLLLKLRYGRPFWKSLAWIAPTRGMLLSVLGGPILAILVGLLGVLLKTPNVQTPMKDLLSDPESLAMVGIFAITAGPICEELAFRGFMLPLLIRSIGPFLGIVVTAIPFGLLHGEQYGWQWQQIVLVTVAGGAFGWMRYITGSTSAATLMHATYNLTFFTAYLFQMRNTFE